MSPRMMMTAALAAVLAAPGVARAKDCTNVSGPFSAVPPATCASPVGICTHGRLTGGLDAAYDFVADSETVVFPTASLTGHSTITIDKGGAVLSGQDTSTLSLQTGDFTTTVHRRRHPPVQEGGRHHRGRGRLRLRDGRDGWDLQREDLQEERGRSGRRGLSRC